MNWPKLKSSNGRLRRSALVAGMAGSLLLGVGVSAAEAATVIGTDPGTVTLNPASGPLSTAPTWSTTEGCPANFQTSAALFGVTSDGIDTDFEGSSNGGTAAAFTGTINSNGTVGQIESLDGYQAGGVEELYVECASGPGDTGNVVDVMYTYIHYNADGSGYTISSSSGTTVPVGEVGGLILAGLAAIGLVILQVRRRMSRRVQPIAS